jgi:hypothetical protein
MREDLSADESLAQVPRGWSGSFHQGPKRKKLNKIKLKFNIKDERDLIKTTSSPISIGKCLQDQ